MSVSVVGRIRFAFRFLEAEYGFTERLFREDEGKPYLGGWVEYASSLTLVSVVVERLGIVFPPDIARAKDQDEFERVGKLSLDRIYEYAVTRPQERLRLASRDYEELNEAWKAFQVLSPLDSLGLIAHDSSLTSDSRVEMELNAYARLLRQHGVPFLRGDFSAWLELHEYQWNWLVGSEMISRRNKAVSAAEVEDSFWRTRAYLEALRREYKKD